MLSQTLAQCHDAIGRQSQLASVCTSGNPLDARRRVNLDQRPITLFVATQWHAPTHGALRTNGVPNARANTGRPGTGPSSAAPKTIEPSGPIGNTRASHCIHPDLARGGNPPHQLKRVMSESGSKRGSASRKNSAAAYSDVNRNCSAMAAGSHGDHAPATIELGRNCRRSGKDDCESARQSEGAHTIANHESTHGWVIRLIGEAPAKGGTPGLPVPLGGTYDGARQNPSQPSLYSRCVLRATPVHFS